MTPALGWMKTCHTLNPRPSGFATLVPRPQKEPCRFGELEPSIAPNGGSAHQAAALSLTGAEERAAAGRGCRQPAVRAPRRRRVRVSAASGAKPREHHKGDRGGRASKAMSSWHWDPRAT